MTGTVAQLIALAGYLNSIVGRTPAPAPDVWPHNSSFGFCDRVRFHVKARDLVFDDPNRWASWLLDEGCSGAWLWRHATADPQLSDRMSAGFVGGGGDWVLYTIVGDGDSMGWHAVTLEQIGEFAKRIGAEEFAACFDQARAALRGEEVEIYHRDLLPEPAYGPEAIHCLGACQAAWVFGGMGSWNDMWFEDEDRREYEALSERCFSQLTSLIVAATNSPTQLTRAT